MKILLLSMFISCGCFGQYPTKELLSDSNMVIKYNSKFYFYKQKTDTIPCIMLVSDTSLQYYKNFDCMTCQRSGYNYISYWQKGYYIENHPWQELGNIQYLDSDKKQLSKNIIVWMSKKN